LKCRLGAVMLMCVGLGISACTTSAAPRHSVVVPNIIGMSREAATRHLSDAGLSPQVISGVPSSRFPAGTVSGSNPSGGVSVATGAPVSLTVSGGISAPPATPVAPSACASGHVAYTPSMEPSSICVRVGSTLTVTFISSGGWSGYGQWSRWPPTISDSSILRGDSWGSSGKTARAVFSAAGTGTATVTASFDVRCAPSDTTPCTVPPEEFHNLTVTVDPR
jgi:PASTA domain